MPSTHVVFEGIDEVKKDIREDEETKPVYLQQIKDYNEKQLKILEKIILFSELSSVCSLYSSDTARNECNA